MSTKWLRRQCLRLGGGDACRFGRTLLRCRFRPQEDLLQQGSHVFRLGVLGMIEKNLRSLFSLLFVVEKIDQLQQTSDIAVGINNDDVIALGNVHNNGIG